MCCILEVAMFVMGIVTLTKGQFTLWKNRVVMGTPAYVVGAVLVATPLTIMLIAFSIGVVLGIQNPEAAQRGEIGKEWVFSLIDITGVLLGLAVVMILAIIYGRDSNAPVVATYASPSSLPPNAPPPVDPNNPYNPPYPGTTNRPNPPYTF